jgi:hypothetical protein
MGKQPRGIVIRKDRDLANVGPFSYNKSFADKKSEPKFSMGAKLDSKLVNKNVNSPSPNAYNVNTSLSKTHYPEFKIGTSARGASYDTRKAKLVPAPGTYNIKSMAFEGLEKPKFHMG